MFSNEMFDAVLCLGSPLGHIIDAKKRDKSIRELIRVAKDQAPIFISVISLIGLLKTHLKNSILALAKNLSTGVYS